MFDREESLKVCASGLRSRQQSCWWFPPTVFERQQQEVDLGLCNGPSVALQSGNDHLQHIWGLSIWHFYIVTYAADPRHWGWMMGENLPCVRLSPADITNCAPDIKRWDLRGHSPLAGRADERHEAHWKVFWPWSGALFLTEGQQL